MLTNASRFEQTADNLIPGLEEGCSFVDRQMINNSKHGLEVLCEASLLI
jgi:hypothetical protein